MQPVSSTRRILAAAIAAVLLPAVVQADPTSDELLQKIEELSQKVLVLERKLEVQDEATKAAVATAPVVKASPRGFSLASADSQNQIKLRGTVHIDGRFFQNEDPEGLKDTWQATRVRPIVEGTLGGIYDFKFMPDFGQGRTVIQDAYVTARFLPAFQFTAGKFKSPVGLERLQSANDIRMVARGFPTQLAPNRDLGLQVAGGLFGERLSYQVAYLNGSNDGGSSETFADVDLNDDKEYAARVFALPFGESETFALRGLGLGIAGTYTSQTGTAAQPLLPVFRTPAQSTFFRYRTGTTPTLADGERTRLAPQLYYYVGRFGLLSEYTTVSQDVSRTTTAGRREGRLDTTAWQVQASWFLTGEEESFRGFKPNNVFSLANDTWGAFELVARYQELDPDDDAFVGGTASFADPANAARKATAYGLGLNWYLNDNLKWVLNYDRTSFDGGAPGGADREDEDVFLTRFALGF
ncbi:MAG: porin [Steroidobacteraceae bacterium]